MECMHSNNCVKCALQIAHQSEPCGTSVVALESLERGIHGLCTCIPVISFDLRCESVKPYYMSQGEAEDECQQQMYILGLLITQKTLPINASFAPYSYLTILQCQTINHWCQWGAARCSLNVCKFKFSKGDSAASCC